MIEKIFIISFIVFAIYATMEDGMIFGFIQDWYWKATQSWSDKKADFWAKPLFLCPTCMTAYYGTPAYWIIFHVSWQEWLIVVISAMGVSEIFLKLFPEKK